MKDLRIFQIGCGKMSKYTMRYVCERGGSIVGAVDISEEIIGRDIGTIMETEDKGVIVDSFDNLEKLLNSKACVWVRVPVVPGVNDTEEEMKNIKAFFETNGYPEKVELLPYHAMGEHKYEALGKATQKFDIPDEEKMEKLKNFVVLR